MDVGFNFIRKLGERVKEGRSKQGVEGDMTFVSLLHNEVLNPGHDTR